MQSSSQPNSDQYRQEYSSDFMFNLQAACLELFDCLFTLFYRWPLIWFRDMQLKSHAAASFGPLEWFALHPVETEIGVIVIFFLGLAKACGFWSDTDYKNEIKRQVYQDQCEEKKISIQKKVRVLGEKQLNFDKDELIKSLNAKIREIQESKESKDETEEKKLERKFFAKFKNAKIDKDKNGELFVKIPTEFKPGCFLLAIWTTIFLSAFYFWVGWIVFVSLTASLANEMPGCSFLVSFIIPFAASALTYMGLKTWHWYNHRRSDGTQKTPEEAFQQASLLEYLLNEELKKREMKEDVVNLSFETTSKPTPENIKKLARHEAAIGCLRGFLQTQYILWISSAAILDYFHLALDLSGTALASDLGIGSFIMAGLFAWKAYRDKCSALDERVDLKINLQEFEDLDAAAQQKLEEAIAKLNPDKTMAAPDLEAAIAQLKLKAAITKFENDISELKNLLAQKNWENQNALRYFFERLGKKEFEFFNSLRYKLLCDFTMSSVFVGRVFLLPCTSPFLPAFLHMAAIASSLSNPVTWTLLFLIAVGWSVFRYHARVQEEKLTAVLKETPKVQKEIYRDLVKEKAILNQSLEEAKAVVTGSCISPARLSKLGMFARCCMPSSSEEPVKKVYPLVVVPG